MTFRDLVSEVEPLLLGSGFHLAENSQNFARYDVGNVSFTIAYNPPECLFYIHAGYKGKLLVESNHGIAREIFGEDYGSDLYASIAPNLVSFLRGKGKSLLACEAAIIDQLYVFSERKAKELTNKIILQQEIKSADVAWSNKDYASFLEQINSIGLEFLPGSYSRNYQIAKSKVKG